MFYKVIDDTLVLSKKSSLMIKEELKDLFPSRKLIYSLLNEATSFLLCSLSICIKASFLE